MGSTLDEAVDLAQKAIMHDVREHLYNIFTIFDLDASGVINEDELTKVMMKLNPTAFTPERCQKMFLAADTNGDNMVDYTEFRDWVCGGAFQKMNEANKQSS